MWRTDTLWFDASVVLALFAVGNICFGRFVEHQSRLGRVAKLVVTLAVVLALAASGQRPVGYALLGVALLAVAYVHGVWLPRHGVNGWTAEPRARYLALVQRPRAARSTPDAPRAGATPEPPADA